MNNKELNEQLAEFAKKTGRELSVKDGKPYYGENLDLEGCTGITSLPEGLTVGGALYLLDTGITSLPEGLTVGGALDLRGTGITSLPEGLTVGGALYLRGTGITSLPEGLTVGGYLDLEEEISQYINVVKELSQEARQKIARTRNSTLRWEWRGKQYIKADGIFSIIERSHGNVFRIRNIGKEKHSYLITDGEGHWAHGDSLGEARADLIYKINDRDTSAYKKMKLDDELTFEEAIAAYRTITGACSAGTRDFIENRLLKPYKKKYTIREMIELTKGEYGSEKLKDFFGN